MAFIRKTYTGPVKNRGTVARGGKELADVSKEELDAFRKKAGNEDLSYKEALRKLLNADRNAKPKAKKPDVPKAKEAPRMDSFTDAPEIIKPVDRSPKKIGEDGKLKNVNPVDMPERRRLGPRTEAPEMIKTSDKKDDTSLSVSERIKNARERVRTSDTGTDKRSVSDRLKAAFGMKKGGMVKKASAKKGSVARGGGAATRGTIFRGVR